MRNISGIRNRLARELRRALAVMLGAWMAALAHGMEPCRIGVVEAGTGNPVPLVELRSLNGLVWVSDNFGLVAMDAPELMDRETYFYVHSHSYEVPADGFGYRGVRVTPRSGGQLKIELTRTSIAERLGRLTGAGRFAQAEKLGMAAPVPETGVLGCDSVLSVVHRGQRYWFWGDTNLAHYPLGVFHMTGARTDDPPGGISELPVAIEYQMFRDANGLPRAVAPLEGEGPTWLSGLVSLPDAQGVMRMGALYSKIRPPLSEYEVGLCVWNDETEVFEKKLVLWRESDGESKAAPDLLPRGHPVRWSNPDAEKSADDELLFGDPLPTLRVAARWEAWLDPASWKPVEAEETMSAASSGDPVRIHRGSISWVPERGVWACIFTQIGGSPSILGEIWYAESRLPTGPWGPAVKVLSHENYTFYNPRIESGPPGSAGAQLYFQGTYTWTFADSPVPTPRWDYNQVLYRIDLADPRLDPARAAEDLKN